MDRFLLIEPIASRELNRPVRDHLIDVHVARRPRAGLEDVNRKLGVELPSDDLLGGVQQCLHLLIIELVLAGLGELPQIAVGDCRGPFDEAHCVNQLRPQGPAGDREVLDRPLSLGAVIGFRGDLDIAHRIVFNAELAHRLALGWQNRTLVPR
jgi:hypothetical protein